MRLKIIFIKKYFFVFFTFIALITTYSALNAFAYENVGNRYGIYTNHGAYTTLNPFYNNGYGGQCTAFAWGRALDRLGITITFNISYNRHAKDWPDIITNPDITFGTSPRKNSIAVWEGDAFNPYGHVAYIEDVDGNDIYIDEANVVTSNATDWGGGYDGFCKKFSIGDLNNRGNGIGALRGYLYLNNPFTNYYYWAFDTQGTEDWNARNALNQGIFNGNYWQIDLLYDSASKSGIVSPTINSIHTDQYDMLEVRAAHKTKLLNHIEAYFKINNIWKGPVQINHISGVQQANSQCVYSGKIGYTGQIQQVRIDFDEGSDLIDDRVYIDKVTFTKSVSSAAVPVTKANGTDGPLTISQSKVLSITIELDSGNQTGQPADWWVLVDTPFGWYRYDVAGNTWISGMSCTHMGPLFDLPLYNVLDISGLPIGSYDFYFGVDTRMNGSIDFAQLYYDSVEVNIGP